MNDFPIEQADLPTPADAADTQVMAFNGVTGQPYDPEAPSVAESVNVGLKFDAPVA